MKPRQAQVSVSQQHIPEKKKCGHGTAGIFGSQCNKIHLNASSL